MTDYVDVCAVSDIPNGKYRAFDIAGQSILIFRMSSDYFAIQNRCTHLKLPLAGGRQIGCEIICPAHGARFDIRNGKAVGSPAVDPVSCFEVNIAGDRIEIKL